MRDCVLVDTGEFNIQNAVRTRQETCCILCLAGPVTMRTPRLASLLVLAFFTGVKSVIVDDQIGSLQLLYQNEVAARTNSTSAILLQKLQNYTDAAQSCHAISETILTGVRLDLKDQLTYLNYSGQLEGDTRVYVSSRAGQSGTCHAYSLSMDAMTEVNCSTELRALCTQSATPYKASQLNAKIVAKRELTLTSQTLSITGLDSFLLVQTRWIQVYTS